MLDKRWFNFWKNEDKRGAFILCASLIAAFPLLAVTTALLEHIFNLMDLITFLIFRV